jgi:hypothetical protein
VEPSPFSVPEPAQVMPFEDDPLVGVADGDSTVLTGATLTGWELPAELLLEPQAASARQVPRVTATRPCGRSFTSGSLSGGG